MVGLPRGSLNFLMGNFCPQRLSSTQFISPFEKLTVATIFMVVMKRNHFITGVFQILLSLKLNHSIQMQSDLQELIHSHCRFAGLTCVTKPSHRCAPHLRRERRI